MKKSIRLYITGTVQGVFFRASTRDYATRLNLVGTVRNLRDGTVEIIAEGVNRLIKLINSLDSPPVVKLKKANILANKINNLARQWQDSGHAQKEKEMFLAGYNHKPYMAGKKEN